MVNEHNIEIPVYWEAVPEDYNWITIDSDGVIHAFFYKPIFYKSKQWVANTPNHWIRFGQVESPLDASKCIWQRN